MKIEAIQELLDFDGKSIGLGSWSNYEGFKIQTDAKEFYILVGNSSSCCEVWGHITSADKLEDFVGAELADYRCVSDANYQDCDLTRKNAGEYVDVYDCAFIDFNTNRGTLQFAVYNSHNGYYGHDIRIVEKSL